jgi:hypothetical protein
MHAPPPATPLHAHACNGTLLLPKYLDDDEAPESVCNHIPQLPSLAAAAADSLWSACRLSMPTILPPRLLLPPPPLPPPPPLLLLPPLLPPPLLRRLLMAVGSKMVWKLRNRNSNSRAAEQHA